LAACAAVAFSAACSSNAPPPNNQEGILVSLGVTERFPPQLVIGSTWIVRSVPGGDPVALRAGATSQGTIGGFPFAAQVIDVGSGRLEYQVVILGPLFGTDRVFEGTLLSSQLTTAPFALEVNLLGTAGVLASAIATTDYRGRTLRFGTKAGLRVELTFDCGSGVPCTGDANRPPVFSAIPGIIQIAHDRQLALSVVATDPDGDAVTIRPPDFTGFPAGNLPSWDAGMGMLTWTPTSAAVSPTPYQVRFTAADSRGAEADPLNIQIQVVNGNSTPVIRALKDQNNNGAPLGGILVVVEGVAISILVDAYDPDNDPLTLSIEPGAGFNPSFDAAAKLFTWTPSFNAGRNEPYTVTFVAQDTSGAQGRRSLSILVIDRNREPVFDPIPDQNALVGAELSFTVHAVDPDGDAFQLAMDDTELPPNSGAQFDPMTGKFRWTPKPADLAAPGPSYTALFTARDVRGGVGKLRVAITVVTQLPSSDGGMGGDGGAQLLVCSHRCGPGEACVGGMCMSVTQTCIAMCGAQQACLGGQCLDTQPNSCGDLCPALTVCVRGGCLSDRDQDGIPDAWDLCPDTPGAPQTDRDGDRIGDACDARPGIPDLTVQGGAPVSATGEESSMTLRVIGTLGEWAMPTVLTGPNTRLLTGPTALGGTTNR
jgi:hypothetical protein